LLDWLRQPATSDDDAVRAALAHWLPEYRRQ
jgi:hypothetical protein